MNVDIGDWIIKGVKGEFYPCKPDIFEMTYDRAALSSQPSPELAGVSDEEIRCLGQRNAWRYKYSSDPAHSSTYKFNDACLLQFARAILALSPAQHAPEWDGGEPANLQAAARDADEWLALIQRLNDAGRWRFSQPDSRPKLDGCRAALSKILCAPAQQAVPMTEEQLKSARRSVCDDPNELPEPWAFRMGIRAAESHHGITAPAGGEQPSAHQATKEPR